MGYNRAGYRAKQKLRRRRKDERRLAKKGEAPAQSPGLLGTVKRVAKHVTAAVEAGVGKVKGAGTGTGGKKPS
jgi:hypothetical protein